MNVFISADIEGVHGVTERCQLNPGGHEYEQARDWMTDEVLTACKAASDCGAKSIVVADAHGNGLNLRTERFSSNVKIVRCWPRPLGMMQGIEQGPFAAALLIGYHCGVADTGGVLAHTFDGSLVAGFSVNGMATNEFGMSRLIAQHFGVPIAMASGDDVFARKVASIAPDTAVAVTKQAYGFSSCCTLTAEQANSAICDKVKLALENLKPPQIPHVVEKLCLHLEFKRADCAEALALFPFVNQVGPAAIEFEADNAVTASQFLEAALIAARGAIT